MIKNTTLFLLLLTQTVLLFGQQASDTVNIPDPNFKTALLNNTDINTNGDTAIQITEAHLFSGSMNISRKGIHNLTGIEVFTNIQKLYCSFNQLTTIDLSMNTKLTFLDCKKSGLTTINLSKNTVLEGIDSRQNNMLTLDLSNNRKLKSIIADNCKNLETVQLPITGSLTTINFTDCNLSTLDLSGNPNLTKILVSNNTRITQLDLSNNKSLKKIDANQLQITALDTRHLPLLTQLKVAGCSLTVLDLKHNKKLTTLNCDSNDFRTLDLSSNKKLQSISCEDSKNLKVVNLRNGKNEELRIVKLGNNSELKCIEIDDPSASYLNSWNSSSSSTYTKNCGAPTITINGPNPQQIVANNPYVELGIHTDIAASITTDASEVKNTNTPGIYEVRYEATNKLSDSSAVSSRIVTVVPESHQKYWSGNISDDGNNPDNWSPKQLPTTNDEVYIAKSTHTFSANDTFDIICKKLHILYDGKMTAKAGAKIVIDELTIKGTCTLFASPEKSAVLYVKNSSFGKLKYQRTQFNANEWSIVSPPLKGQVIQTFINNKDNDIRKNEKTLPIKYSMAYYDDSQPSGHKWHYYTDQDLSTATNFVKGKGYAFSRATNGGVNFSGSVPIQNIDITVPNNQWVALGNPYTCNLKLNSGTSNFLKANTKQLAPENQAVYLWDPSQGKYIPKLINDSPLMLAVTQGFFIKSARSTKANTISFKESFRSTDSNNPLPFYKASLFDKLPSISIYLRNKKLNIPTTIFFSKESTKQLNPGADIGNFDGAKFDIYTKLASNDNPHNFTVQALHHKDLTASHISIGISAPLESYYDLQICIKNIPESTNVYLEDRLFHKFHQIINSFKKRYHKRNSSSYGRFFIHTLTNKNTIQNSPVTIYFNDKNKLIVRGSGSPGTSIALYAMSGALITKRKNLPIACNRHSIPSLPTGLYLVVYSNQQGEQFAQRVLKK